MIKKLLILSSLVLALAVLLLGYVVVNANSIVSKFQPKLESIASSALGADIGFGKLDLKVIPTLRLVVSEIKVKGGADNLALKSIIFHLRLFPLLKGELVISKLLIDAPAIRLIKEADGTRVAGLPKPTAKKGNDSAVAASAPSASGSSVTSALNIRLESFELKALSLLMEDRTANTEQSLLSALNLSAAVALKDNKVSLSGFKVDGSILGKGNLTIDAGEFESAISPELAFAGFVHIKKFEFSPTAELKITEGNGKIAIKGSPTAQTVSTDDFKLSLGGEAIKVQLLTNLSPAAINVERILIEAFSGKTEGQAKLTLTGTSRFDAAFDLSGIQINQALKAVTQTEPALSGNLDRLSVKLGGELGTNLMSSLKGSIGLMLKDGELKGVNVAGEVLKSIQGLPFMKGTLAEAVPESERASLENNVTTIKELSANFTVADSKIQTPDLRLISSIFELEGNGQIGFDKGINFNTTMLFSSEFSSLLSEKVKELPVLCDDKGRLTVPVVLSGTLPKVIPLPNMQKLLEVAGKGLLREKGASLLEGFLGGKKDGSAAGNKKKGLFGF